MKAKNVALISFVVLLSIATTLCADSESADTRPYMGVWLDTSALPDLLIKHLGLSPDQGIRISNVHSDSSADRAGLERDDIIIGFQGKKVMNSEPQKFVDEVRKAGIGTEVSLEIIHLGQPKTIRLKLEPFKSEREFKYPTEPEIFQSWRPGRMFRLKPGDKDWMEIQLPFDVKSLEVYHYHHSDEEEGYSVTIEGNPEDEDALITVRIGRDEYQTAVGKIDKLPEKYREIAQKTLEDSRKYSRQIKNKTRESYFYNMLNVDKYTKNLEEFAKNLKERTRFHLQPDLPKFDPDNKMLDKIEKQMRKLQERIEELEKRLGETPERLPDKPDKQESQEQEKPAQPENKDRLKV
jgi:hypothetical protein